MTYAKIMHGNCIEVLRSLQKGSVQCCVTSPPYFGLRDYGQAGQIGMESDPAKYIESLLCVFKAVHRVLSIDGTLWVNLGDSYAANRSYQVRSTKGNKKHGSAQSALGKSVVPPGLKPKDLIGIPWRVALALQSAGWYLRSEIIWNKPNALPESVRDRPTRCHEHIFLLSKSRTYLYNASSIKEPFKSPGQEDKLRNKRTVWDVCTRPYKGSHFAAYPKELILPCILAGSSEGHCVLDPFNGSGTTGEVAVLNNRSYIGVEINEDYVKLSQERFRHAGIDLVIDPHRKRELPA